MSEPRGFRATPLPLPGAWAFAPPCHRDNRGAFVKTFHAPSHIAEGLHFELREEFYSVSHRGVLRGMHFQTPPYDHQKLVTCVAGRVLDVLLDLRHGSHAYGQACSLELDAKNPLAVWIPKGLAHGFLSLEDDSCVTYKTDREYAPDHDAGVRWDSFGFAWPLLEEPIVSPRDRRHPPWGEFASPFGALVAAGG